MIKTIAGLFLILALSSCASVSVEDGAQRITQTKPKMIYVLDFNTAGGDWQVDRQGNQLADLKRELQLLLQQTMCDDLSNRLIYAQSGTKTDWAKTQNAWLIRGQFVTVNQGSRALRGAIGMGAGGTKLEVQVEVYDLSYDSGTPFMSFKTSGGSNAEPGAVFTTSTAPATLAIGAAGNVMHGLSEDTKRTAREITAALSNYMYERGWIGKDQWIEPKRSHDTPLY